MKAVKFVSNLPENMPENLVALFGEMARDFPLLLENNLVGIYLWGSLTYAAFDPRCSDADAIVVTREAIDEDEFAKLESWFDEQLSKNNWAAKLDMRFVIDGEFLDKTSRCCGFHFGKLTRHGSDANPFIWLNIGTSGITLYGAPAKEIAPEISREVLRDALFLELEYLKEDLAANAGDQSELAFFHNSYAVLTACRIYHTACNDALVSKAVAACWTLENTPREYRAVINTAQENRLAGKGLKKKKLERDAINFVLFIESQVKAWFKSDD